MEITEIILTSALVNGVFVLIIQSWIKNTFAKELETHRDNLSRLTAQNNFRFSHVFVKTEETIADIYRKLLAVLDASEDATNLLPPPTPEQNVQRIQKLQIASDNFYEAYRPNKIYIPKKTAKRIQEFYYQISDIVRKHLRAEMIVNTPPTASREHLLKKFNTEITKLKNEVPSLLSALEDDFQVILGFPIDEKK